MCGGVLTHTYFEGSDRRTINTTDGLACGVQSCPCGDHRITRENEEVPHKSVYAREKKGGYLTFHPDRDFF